MTPVDLVLSRLSNPRPNSAGWAARCPAHNDHHPSLSIGEGDDGRALVKCHAGCPTEKVVAAMGLEMADLMPQRFGMSQRTSRRPKQSAKAYPTAREAVVELERLRGERASMWTYTDAGGVPIGVVLRWDTEDGKEILPVSRFEGWRVKAMPQPRPLYRLPDLPNAKRIYITEGEKPADAARSIGVIATTSAGGAGAAHMSDWLPLAGKEAVILPDNDGAGGKYADDVTDALAALVPPPSVKVVELPDLPEGGDIVEFIAGRRSAGLDNTAICAEVESLSAKAPPVKLTPPTPKIGCYRPFPVEALPEPVRSFVNVSARAIGCDTSYTALPTLAALASAVGNSRRIQLKRGWTEPAILWTAIVGESGMMKSPALELALRAVRKRQHDAMRNFEGRMEDYRDRVLRYERDLGHWKHNKDRNGDPPMKPEKPVAERYWCDDATVESLAALLLDQPRGLLMVRDELAGWIGGFDRYAQGKGGDVAKWLEMHGGRPMVVDRKTTGTIYIPMAAVSITGGIQPETLRRRLGIEHLENGLAARLLLTMPPRRAKRWTEDEVEPEVEEAIETVFERLCALEPEVGNDGDPRPVVLAMTPAGKRTWIAFYNRHADEQTDLTRDLSAAWSKLEGYVARFALVVHLIRWAARDDTLVSPHLVDEISVAAGVTLSEWFGDEARRVYAMLVESDDDRDQRQLVDLIRHKGGAVTVRDLMRSSRQFGTAADTETALVRLAKAGYGQWQDVPSTGAGGRPTRRFILVDGADVDTTPASPGERGGSVNVNGVDGADGVRAAAVQDAWQERMAICEVDGGLSAGEAEQIALEETRESA